MPLSVVTENSANVAWNTSLPLPNTHSLTGSQKYYGKNTFACWHLSGLLCLLRSDFYRPRNKCLRFIAIQVLYVKSYTLWNVELLLHWQLKMAAGNGSKKLTCIDKYQSRNKCFNLQILMPRFTWQDMYFCYLNTVKIWCCYTWSFPKTDIFTLGSIYKGGAVSLYGIHEFGPIKERGWLYEREVCMSSIS